MRKSILRLSAVLLFTAALLGGCAKAPDTLQDGYYSAIAADFDTYGWKEYVTIYVSDGRIITVEYNAANLSGFVKSWDMAYMQVMNAADGTYPNKYTREYADALLNRQDPFKVDAVSGATHSHVSFQLLSQAAIDQAKQGDRNIAYVDIPIPEEAHE